MLGRWNSTEAPGGVYHLKLELIDAYLGTIQQEIVIALPDDPTVTGLTP